MAEKRRFLDVWIIETNTVYREVPYNVVTDWLQQGRLLADDRLRPSGTGEWLRVGESPAFEVFLPRPEPFRADDEAEALEPVELGISWKRRHDDEDDDVDMIPLIDVSLVLLVFFIMTTTGVVLASNIPTPPAMFGNLVADPGEMIWIGIDKGAGDAPVYSIGEGDRPPAGPEDRDLASQKQVLDRLDAKLEARGNRVKVLVRGHEEMPTGVVRRLQIELEKRPNIEQKFHGVSEKKLP